jgi:CRP-like cAMP-binding protein
MTNKPNKHSNQLLNLLSRKEASALEPHLQRKNLPSQMVLYEPGKRIQQVYFVTHGVVSLVKKLDSGETIEIATVGPEGMIGAVLALGSDTTDNRAIVQVPGESLSMKASTFKRVLKRTPKLHQLLLRYVLALLNQVAQSAACNRVHSVDERCARWLLMTHDRVKEDTFLLTQDFLAQMLGVHRPTVSVAASTLQKAGLIRYVRGTITITDRKGLEKASCGCYRSISKEYERLLNIGDLHKQSQ